MQKIKIRKSKYVEDKQLKNLNGVKSLTQVAETEEDFNDIIKEAKITRVANKGDNFITQTTEHNVVDIEVDWDSIVYKYLYNGEEFFSNFLFNNPVETIYPQINDNAAATVN
jgi:hypothetical protein